MKWLHPNAFQKQSVMIGVHYSALECWNVIWESWRNVSNCRNSYCKQFCKEKIGKKFSLSGRWLWTQKCYCSLFVFDITDLKPVIHTYSHTHINMNAILTLTLTFIFFPLRCCIEWRPKKDIFQWGSEWTAGSSRSPRKWRPAHHGWQYWTLCSRWQQCQRDSDNVRSFY